MYRTHKAARHYILLQLLHLMTMQSRCCLQIELLDIEDLTQKVISYGHLASFINFIRNDPKCKILFICDKTF